MMQSLQSLISILTNRKKTFLFVGIILGVALTYSTLTWLDSDPQGEANSNCDKFDQLSTANGKGMTVSSHTTACTTLGTSVLSYVYVHPSDQRPAAKHLVFRYSQSGSDDSLKTEWIDERHLTIQIKRVSRVSKLQTTFGLISIDYKIEGG